MEIVKIDGVVTKSGQRIIQYQNGLNRSPLSSKEIIVGNLKIAEKSYEFTEQDGPLAQLKGYQEVMIDNGKITIVATHLGVNESGVKLFEQILSTFKFTK